jgi:hypothetical protein
MDAHPERITLRAMGPTIEPAPHRTVADAQARA